MKNQKSAERFVDDIIKDLPLSQYTPRFREELLEHMEDGEEDLIDRNENNISEKIMQKIGDKSTLVKSYKNFHRNCCSRLWPIELLVYIVLFFNVFDITNFIINRYDLITDPSLRILKPVTISFSILIAYTFNRIVFSFVAKRLSPYVSSKRERVLIISSIILLPILSSLYDWLYVWYVYDRLDMFNLIIIILESATVYVAAGIAFGLIAPRDKEVSANSAKIPYLLLFIFVAAMLCSIPLAEQKAATLSGSWQFMDVMVSFLQLPIKIWYDLFFLVANTAEASGLNIHILNDPAIFFRIFAISLAIPAIGGIWLISSASKSKSENSKIWKRAAGIALVTYSAFILLPINKTGETKLEWNIPSLNISDKIEQKQQGLLYPLQKYINQQVGLYSQDYFVFQEDNRFAIEQFSNNNFNYFLIDVNNVPKGQTPVITVTTKRDNTECADDNCTNELAYQLAHESFLPYEGIFPQGFECPDCIKDQPDPTVYTEFKDEGTLYITDYTHLTYNKHKIFNTEQPFANIIDIKISDNREWAIFRIGYDAYLVDLRELK